MKRKRGGQPGNQNARKHGFYSKERGGAPAPESEFRMAARVLGLNEEISLLRVRIKELVRQDSPDFHLISQHLKSLASLVAADSKAKQAGGADAKHASEFPLELLDSLLGLGDPPGKNSPCVSDTLQNKSSVL